MLNIFGNYLVSLVKTKYISTDEKSKIFKAEYIGCKGANSFPCGHMNY